MGAQTLWTIGSRDGRATDLVDNFKDPNAPGAVVWRVGTAERQHWPRFHPSEADPDAGYRPHPYAIEFDLDDEPRGAYRIAIHYLVIAPRLAHLTVDVNGVAGTAYLRPNPSTSGEIRLHAGLHTTIYADGVSDVIIPACLLRRGANRLILTARDDGEVLHVERIEAIRRLDRMANSAGFIYQAIEFVQLAASPESVLARADVRSSVVYARGADGKLRERCHLYLEVTRAVDASTLALSLRSAQTAQDINVEAPAASFGHVHIPFDLDDGDGPVAYSLSGELAGERISVSGDFARKRKWTVYVTPHVHTDIGYTHRQWEVAERLCRTVDAALDLLEDPERAGSVAYHLDSTWALETYLHTRGAERRRQLIDQVRAGRFGVPGAYVDLLTQVAALEDLIRNGEHAQSLLRPEGLRTDFSSIVDVASLTGSLPAVLEGSGIRYLVHANNQDRGPFRLLGGLHRRSPYYWEGTNGGRVLVWLAKMYCELRKVCGSPPVLSSAERGLDLWLDEYERDDYAPDAVLLYGQEADNTDLDPQPGDEVARWNETYAFPRLIPSAVGDFFRDVEARFGDHFPVVQGDGGAYWEDGAGSSLRGTARIRHAQDTLPAAETLEALAVIHGNDLAYPLASFDEAWRQLLLADEHTWGAFLSGPEPDALLARDQWATKMEMVDTAASWADRLLHVAAARHSLSWNTDGREVVVYNTHGWPVSGPATVEIAVNEQLVDPATGDKVPTRRLHATASQAVVEIWVDDLPGLSYRRYILQAGSQSQIAAPSDVSDAESVAIENRFYRLEVAPRRGVVTSCRDKTIDRELVDRADQWGFGQLIYARGGEGTRLVSNQSDLPDGNPELLGEFELTSCRQASDAIGTSLTMTGRVPYGTVDIAWTLPESGRWVDVRYTYDKEERRDKEAVYVAFPFTLPDAAVRSDSQLGWVDWDRDQLPGGCKEWLPLQTGILVSGADAAALVCSPDVPLFCAGDVVRGRWPKEMKLSGGRIFSYVLNNYWHTNYPAAQGGPLTFSYRLTSDAAIQPDVAYRLGWQTRRPLYAHRISFQDFRQQRHPYADPAGGTLAAIDTDQVVVTTLKRARWHDGWIVRLQEIAGRNQVATLRIPDKPITRAWRTNLLEEEIESMPVEKRGGLPVPVPAWGLTTVRFTVGGTARQDLPLSNERALKLWDADPLDG